jgi:hypothetical protein
MHIGASDDLAVVGERFVVALDGREVVEIVDHEAGALSETLLAASPIQLRRSRQPHCRVKAGHGIKRLSGLASFASKR